MSVSVGALAAVALMSSFIQPLTASAVASDEVITYVETQLVADVQAMAEGATLLDVDGDGSSAVTTARTTDVGEILMIHYFTEAFIDGTWSSDLDPVVASDSYLVALLDGTEPLGTALVGATPTGQYGVLEVNEDPGLAAALADLRQSDVLVSDPPAAAWFALEGSTLHAVYNAGSRSEYSLAEYTEILQTYLDEAREAASDVPDGALVGGGGDLGPERSTGTNWWFVVAGLGVGIAGIAA